MDDLFLEVLRRRVEEGFERFARVLAEDRSLRSLWRLSTAPPGARFNVEFAALANHRKAIRDELVRYAETFRRMQLDAMTTLLAEHGVTPDVCPPVVAIMAMMGTAQIMGIEKAFGMSAGHEETMAFVERFIDDLESA
jgi:TetR/AcrR family transcriptional regulator